jgi:RNA polymerase sigma factor (sigma-70 family)
MVEDVLQGRKSDNSDVYGDSIQEGLSALLDAMSSYREDEHTEDFETYARKEIYQHLTQSLDKEVRPIRLPKGVKAVVKEATWLMAKAKSSGQRPTLAQIAAKLNLPVDRLQDYLRLAKATYRSTLSMESTIEILNPLLDDSAPAYRDQEEWELREGLLLDNGRSDHRDELVDEYLDETIQREGDDETWIQEVQIAGRLKDLIPDTDELSPDDLILEELMRSDLAHFLSSTLESQEIEVIRLFFGLDSGKAMSVEEVAKALEIPVQAVSKLLAEGLEELRVAYAENYIEPGGFDHPEESV